MLHVKAEKRPSSNKSWGFIVVVSDASIGELVFHKVYASDSMRKVKTEEYREMMNG